ncbi:MAG: GDYXXLXY domain-containing protein [Erythrobacter sp.]|nr:GDYXXLXY domain-containing protein [Erythrobacter sp.]
MKAKVARLAVVVLPVIGLGGLWAWSDHLSRQGTEWDVAVRGYDPRDLLRGHYVEFTYDWPEPEREEELDGPTRLIEAPRLLCLHGDPPELELAERIEEDSLADCAHPARANPAGVYGYGSLRRGRFYVGQDRAREIDDAMRDRDQRGIVRIRQRDDGTITPVSIRFRPLTAAEIEERDRQSEETVDP